MANPICYPLLAAGCLLLAAHALPVRASDNLLQNPGFEEASPQGPSHWTTLGDSAGYARSVEKDAHSGARCLALPGNSAVEQTIANVQPGAYLVRFWVKSEAAQAITVVLENPEAPTAAYTYADLKIPKDRWVQMETFCAVEQAGALTLTLGGMSREFRSYHGGTSEMRAPVLVDDCELVRFDRKPAAAARVWDAGKDLAGAIDWKASGSWSVVHDSASAFSGTPILQDGRLAGAVRTQDGALLLYALEGGTLHSRAVLIPEPALTGAHASFVQADGKAGIRVTAGAGGAGYTAWLSPEGVIDIEAGQTPRFRLQECQLRYGLLPSFVGTDLCYAPEKLGEVNQVNMPSAQWFVGLRDGGESMLVIVWKSGSQAASLTLSGAGKDRMIDAVSMGTSDTGFSLGLVEHANIWSQQPLSEDWLGEYTPLSWQRPFPARWMARFFVSTGGKASFRTPHMSYSFPIANANTRMWGVWFEDWNHYPFYFDDSRLIAHFEKTFVPNGDALFYFLEPAAADVISPCEIVDQVLGKDQASALFDLEGNHLRKLHYSTPPEFMYDRPVCATTTRLSGIRKDEKPTVGVNLATHLFEFIREIRGRVDQYVAFFDQLNGYLDSEEKAHPDAHAYVAELRSLVAEARTRAKDAYDTPLSTVQAKTDSMKKLLEQGKGDGFDCGTLDVRGPAGTQDDLCRRYNRLVLRLCETAALNCGNSPEKAAIATHLWQESHLVLRQPTRWEPRRTLYFFEP